MAKFVKKVPLIMLLLETSNKINRDRIQGILRYERLYGPWRLHVVEGKRFEQPVRDVVALGVDGIIAGTTLTELMGPVMQARVPKVFFDTHCIQKGGANPFLKHASVTCDNEAVGRFGAEFLLEKGFSHFAYVEDIWGSPWSTPRLEGFTRRLAASGASCEIYRVTSDSARDDWSVDQKEMAAWLKGLPKPVGIFVACDVRGQQVLDTCLTAGVRVPDQAAVLGVDNDELTCSTTNPTLSSILRDTEGSGYLAAELLDRMMRQRGRRREVLQYGPIRVVERMSTERLQFVDHLAVKAVEFIRINSGVGMKVSDVVRHLGVSRRLAEVRFRQAVGRSIHEEIQKSRLEHVCRLLRETDIPIGTISAQCGFVTESYLGLIFKRHHQCTMREFRRSAH